MKTHIALLFLSVILPAFLQATPDAWWGRKKPRPKPTPRPQPYGQASCSATGDPHYLSFDKKRYNFMGTCNYILATDHCKTRRGKQLQGTFKVITENRKCGRSVSCVKSVTIIIRGSKIELTTLARQDYRDTTHFTVKKVRNKLKVTSKPAGLTVTWDGRMNVHVYLSAAYRSKVCGLCGNYDGHRNNDLIMSNGKAARNVNQFGNSWGFGKHCPSAPPVPLHPCDNNPKRKEVAEKDCYVIKSCNFQECKAAGVDTDQLYADCLYDVCADEEDTPQESSCEAVREATQQCKDQTGKTVSWGHLADRCEENGKCSRKVKLFSSCETKCCVFPFTKNGVKHTDCVKSDFGSWCSSEKVATADSIGLCVPEN